VNVFETAQLLLGRLHPLFVHFPLALLTLAAGVELARSYWQQPELGRLVAFLVWVGLGGALLAALTGWIFARESPPRPTLAWALSAHRWLGVATLVVTSLTAYLATRWAETDRASLRWLRRMAVCFTAAITALTGHFGALLVWGEEHFDLTN
jgi:uncharacterized membrane protein